MLFVIGMSILFTLCVLMTVILVTKIMRSAYEKRFKKNIHRHLDVLPKKTEPIPEPEEPSILSFALLERFYREQYPQLMLPYYKEKQTAAYIQSLPVVLPPTYDQINTKQPSPPPSYIYTDLDSIPEEDENKIQNV